VELNKKSAAMKIAKECNEPRKLLVFSSLAMMLVVRAS
jgi:hypothetical protein